MAKKHAFYDVICKISKNQGFWAITAQLRFFFSFY